MSPVDILAYGHRVFSGSEVQSQANTLTAPTNLTASDNAYSTKVGLGWDAVRSATLYRVFRNPVVNSARSRNAGADGVFGTADDVFASPGVVSNNSDGTHSWSTLYGFREQFTGRKSRSYIDAGYSNSLFWDGRATQTFSDPIGGAVILPNGARSKARSWVHPLVPPRWPTPAALGTT